MPLALAKMIGHQHQSMCSYPNSLAYDLSKKTHQHILACCRRSQTLASYSYQRVSRIKILKCCMHASHRRRFSHPQQNNRDRLFRKVSCLAKIVLPNTHMVDLPHWHANVDDASYSSHSLRNYLQHIEYINWYLIFAHSLACQLVRSGQQRERPIYVQVIFNLNLAMFLANENM